jgi:putative hemolysin
MGLELPEDEADTIGGFVFGLLGHQAEQGETVAWDGLEFQVTATDGRRIQKVRLTRRPAPESALPPANGGANPANGASSSASASAVGDLTHHV